MEKDAIESLVQCAPSTFVVEIQYCQSATWQGTITWIESKKVQKFRSELELLWLIEEALSADDASASDITWSMDCNTLH